jgi:hypothetical protein
MSTEVLTLGVARRTATAIWSSPVREAANGGNAEVGVAALSAKPDSPRVQVQ